MWCAKPSRKRWGVTARRVRLPHPPLGRAGMGVLSRLLTGPVDRRCGFESRPFRSIVNSGGIIFICDRSRGFGDFFMLDHRKTSSVGV